MCRSSSSASAPARLRSSRRRFFAPSSSASSSPRSSSRRTSGRLLRGRLRRRSSSSCLAPRCSGPALRFALSAEQRARACSIGDLLGRHPLGERRVRLPVLHVGAVAPGEDHHRLAVGGVGAPARGAICRLAARALRLRQQLQRARQAHRVDVVGGRQRPEVAARAPRRGRSARSPPAPPCPLSGCVPSVRGRESSRSAVSRSTCSGLHALGKRGALRLLALLRPRPAARRGRSAPRAGGPASPSPGRVPSTSGPSAFARTSSRTSSSLRSAGATPSGSEAVTVVPVLLHLHEGAELPDPHPAPAGPAS